MCNKYDKVIIIQQFINIKNNILSINCENICIIQHDTLQYTD